MEKTEFEKALKHGKCEGRIQLHNKRIHPWYCIYRNSAEALHACPDQDGFWVKEDSRCNCCEKCRDVCWTSVMARENMKNENREREIKRIKRRMSK